jgi:hypothetical protein
MLKVGLFSIISILIFTSSYTQQRGIVSGTVVDSTGAPLRDVYIKLVSGKDSITKTTNAGGIFSFSNVGFSGFNLSATMIGYQAFNRWFNIPSKNNSQF